MLGAEAVSLGRWAHGFVLLGAGAAALLGGGASVMAIDRTEETCLALALYWEAKSEGREGMLAVGSVVLNRVEHPEFPGTVCAVIHEGGETPPCQFAFWCDGKGDKPEERETWRLARQVARQILAERPDDPTGGALFFHATDIDVPWRVERERTAEIGGHVYYR